VSRGLLSQGAVVVRKLFSRRPKQGDVEGVWAACSSAVAAPVRPYQPALMAPFPAVHAPQYFTASAPLVPSVAAVPAAVESLLPSTAAAAAAAPPASTTHTTGAVAAGDGVASTAKGAVDVAGAGGAAGVEAGDGGATMLTAWKSALAPAPAASDQVLAKVQDASQ
jgi:hypothetical protein